MKKLTITLFVCALYLGACTNATDDQDHDHGDGTHTHDHDKGDHHHDEANEQEDFVVKDTANTLEEQSHEDGHGHDHDDHDH